MTDVIADATSQSAGSSGGAPKAARNLKDDARKIAASAQERATHTADQVRRTVGEQSAAAREWAADQADVLRDTVQTRPFISVGVSAGSAFAAGLIVGVLLARR